MAITDSLIRTALFGAVLMFLLTGCPSVCPDAVYQFTVESKFTPERDSLRVGDTLYLSSSFSTQPMDVNSGQIIEYAHAVNVGSDLFVQELPADRTMLKGAVSNFSFVAIKGRIYNDTSTPNSKRVNQLVYKQSRANYELLIGLIPHKEGVYCVATGNGLSAGRPDKGCDKASLDIHVVNPNQHLHYLKDYLGSASITPYSMQKGYCFKVIKK